MGYGQTTENVFLDRQIVASGTLAAIPAVRHVFLSLREVGGPFNIELPPSRFDGQRLTVYNGAGLWQLVLAGTYIRGNFATPLLPGDTFEWVAPTGSAGAWFQLSGPGLDGRFFPLGTPNPVGDALPITDTAQHVVDLSDDEVRKGACAALLGFQLNSPANATAVVVRRNGGAASVPICWCAAAQAEYGTCIAPLDALARFQYDITVACATGSLGFTVIGFFI